MQNWSEATMLLCWNAKTKQNKHENDVYVTGHASGFGIHALHRESVCCVEYCLLVFLLFHSFLHSFIHSQRMSACVFLSHKNMENKTNNFPWNMDTNLACDSLSIILVNCVLLDLLLMSRWVGGWVVLDPSSSSSSHTHNECGRAFDFASSLSNLHFVVFMFMFMFVLSFPLLLLLFCFFFVSSVKIQRSINKA